MRKRRGPVRGKKPRTQTPIDMPPQQPAPQRAPYRSWFTAEDAFRRPGLVQAGDFLADYLQDGPLDNQDVFAAGNERGIPTNNIRRAAEEMNIGKEKYPTDGEPRPGKKRGRRFRERWGL